MNGKPNLQKLDRSSVDHSDAVSCPICSAILLTAGTATSDLVRCAGCGHQFRCAPSGGTAAPVRTSRLATASLVTGLGSLMFGFLSGIPAVLLGVLALRNIRRSKKGVQGRGLAIAGIVSGGTSSLACVSLVGCLAWVASTVHMTSDPDEVMRMAANMGTFDFPPGVQARKGDQLPFGIKVIRYGEHKNPMLSEVQITTVYYPDWAGFDHKQAKAQLRYHEGALRGKTIESKDATTLRVGDEDIEISKQLRRSRRGNRFRAYVATISATSGVVLVIVSVLEPSDAAAADSKPRLNLTDQQVYDFFQSYKSGA